MKLIAFLVEWCSAFNACYHVSVVCFGDDPWTSGPALQVLFFVVPTTRLMTCRRVAGTREWALLHRCGLKTTVTRWAAHWQPRAWRASALLTWTTRLGSVQVDDKSIDTAADTKTADRLIPASLMHRHVHQLRLCFVITRMALCLSGKSHGPDGWHLMRLSLQFLNHAYTAGVCFSVISNTL